VRRSRAIGDQLTVEAHNDSTSDTLALAGTITPNDFGGAGVARYGTVPRGGHILVTGGARRAELLSRVCCGLAGAARAA